MLLRANAVAKSRTHPIGLDFAVIGQVRLLDKYHDVIRIDNSLHHGKAGVHLHFLDKSGKRVEYAEDVINPTQAMLRVEEYLKKRYYWLFEGDDDEAC